MEDKILPLRRPARLMVYPFIEIQDFEDETIEQATNEENLQW